VIPGRPGQSQAAFFLNFKTSNSFDKGKPVERRGRKAMDLTLCKAQPRLPDYQKRVNGLARNGSELPGAIQVNAFVEHGVDNGI
jgi:hypothetical protein